jgi:hypothetical protein
VVVVLCLLRHHRENGIQINFKNHEWLFLELSRLVTEQVAAHEGLKALRLIRASAAAV